MAVSSHINIDMWDCNLNPLLTFSSGITNAQPFVLFWGSFDPSV
jgi:hypothetical protein